MLVEMDDEVEEVEIDVLVDREVLLVLVEREVEELVLEVDVLREVLVDDVEILVDVLALVDDVELLVDVVVPPDFSIVILGVTAYEVITALLRNTLKSNVSASATAVDSIVSE